jgi:hypothetical protein
VLSCPICLTSLYISKSQDSGVWALHRARGDGAAGRGAGAEARHHRVHERGAEGPGDVPGDRGVLQGRRPWHVGAALHASALTKLVASIAEADRSMYVCAAIWQMIDQR